MVIWLTMMARDNDRGTSYTGPMMFDFLTRAAGKKGALIVIVTFVLNGQLATAIEYGQYQQWWPPNLWI